MIEVHFFCYFSKLSENVIEQLNLLDSKCQARRSVPNEPTQVRKVRGHGGSDISVRGDSAAQFALPLRRLAHLHLFGIVLCDHQPLQGAARLHHEDGQLLQGQEEE